jgi:hypothetical protein
LDDNLEIPLSPFVGNRVMVPKLRLCEKVLIMHIPKQGKWVILDDFPEHLVEFC